MRRLLVACLALVAPVSVAPAASLVVANDAGPVAGAVVRWTGGEARSDDAGHVALDGFVAPGCVVARGHVPVALEALPPGGRLSLKAATATGGRVTTPDGAGVAGVTLHVAGDEPLGACARSAVSDAAGAWVVDGLMPGRSARLRIVAPPGHVAPRREAEVLAAVPPRRLDVLVLPAVAVPLVVTGADGKPLAGARVRVDAKTPLRGAMELGEDEAAELAAFEATTDVAGTVALPPLARADGWRVVVRHDAHAPASLRLDLRTGTPAPSLAMKRGGTIVARAVDEAAQPWGRVAARLTSSSVKDADLVPEPKTSGADGVVRIERLPAGRWDLELRAPGARSRVLPGVEVRDGGVTSVGDAVLEAGVALSGRVLGDGEPVAGAEVVLFTTADGARLRLKATSSSDGAFVFEGLDPGVPADLSARADGWTSKRLRGRETGESDVVLELQRAATLVVVARDAETGDALTELDVEVSGERGRPQDVEPRTDEARPGEVLVPGIAAGERDVTVTAEGRVPERRRGLAFAAGEELRLSLELSRGDAIEGRVVEASSGAGVALAEVMTAGQDAATTTRSDGSFRLEGLRGPVELIVTHAKYVMARLPGADPALPPEGGWVIALERGGGVEGVVHGPDGAPLEGASVSDVDGGRQAVTDAAGHYLLEGLAAGERHLRKTDRPGSFEGLEMAGVVVQAGSTARRDFGTGLRIAGVVTWRGEPVRGARIGAMLSTPGRDPELAFSRGLASATSDAAGRYSVALESAGTYALAVAWRGRRFGRSVVVPEGGGVVTEDIEIPDLRVTGRVVDAETGEPVRGAHVSLMPKSAPSEGAMNLRFGTRDADGGEDMLDFSTEVASTDDAKPDGSFELLVDQPGPAAFSAWAEGYESWKAADDFEVTRSVEVTVPMVRKGAAKRLRVRLVDAGTGVALAGTMIVTTRRGDAITGSNVMGEAAVAELLAPEEGAVAEVVAWAPGRGVATRGGIEPTGEDIDVEMALSPGGSARVLVPEGALQPSGMRGFTGDLRVELPGGVALGAGDGNVQMNLTRSLVTQAGAGEWVIRDLPPGPVTFRLGTGAPRVAEIVAGETVDVDLR